MNDREGFEACIIEHFGSNQRKAMMQISHNYTAWVAYQAATKRSEQEIKSLKADLEKIRQFNYEFAVENEQLTKKLAEAEKFIPDGAAYAFYNDQCKEG